MYYFTVRIIVKQKQCLYICFSLPLDVNFLRIVDQSQYDLLKFHHHAIYLYLVIIHSKKLTVYSLSDRVYPIVRAPKL